MRNIKWAAPQCSYYFASGAGEPPKEPITQKDYDKLIEKLESDLVALDERLDTATDEARTWTKTEISSLRETLGTIQQALETIKANSENSVEGLLQQVTELKTQVADLSTRQPPVPPADQSPAPEPPLVTPPKAPKSNEGAADPPVPAKPEPPKARKRVV